MPGCVPVVEMKHCMIQGFTTENWSAEFMFDFYNWDC